MKKLISLILAASVFVTLLPAAGSADDGGSEATDIQQTQETVSNNDENGDAVTQEDYIEPASVSVSSVSSLVRPLSEYDADMAAIEGTPEQLAENPDYVKLLLQRRLVGKAGYENLVGKMNADADFAACMNWFFDDYEMLCDYVYGGEPEANGNRDTGKVPTQATYMRSFEVLTLLYTNHSGDVADGGDNTALFKRLMCAVALTHSVDVGYWGQRLGGVGFNWLLYSEPLGRYELFRKFYLNGFLVDQFDQYNVEELRMSVGAPIDNAQLEWMHYWYRVKRLNDADYATDPLKVSRGNIGAVGGLFPYAVYDIHPSGLGARFYDDAYYDQWNTKYGLEVHDDFFDFKVPYGYNEKNQVFMPQWVFLEVGGVCVPISMCSVVGFNAFGIPSLMVVQPGHCSFWQYYKSGDTVVGSQGYNVFGTAKSTAKEHGQTHLPAGWGDLPYTSHYNFAYLFIGTDATYSKYGTDFRKAENLVFMGNNSYEAKDYEKAAELYNKALEAQYFNMDAWDGLAKAYEKTEKTDDEFYETAKKAADALKWYPLAMYDYLTGCLMPKIKSQVVKADIIALTRDTLNISAGAKSPDCPLSQPAWCVQLAGECRNKLTQLAAFSFNTCEITLNKDYASSGAEFMFSLDGGTTWISRPYNEGETVFKLTDEEADAVTDANDIYYKLNGEDRVHLIGISTFAAPTVNLTTNTPNDNEDVFINLQNGLEYSTDDGVTWYPLTASALFEGDVAVLVRRARAGTALASPTVKVEFTQNEGTPERSYIKMKNNVTMISCPDGMKSNPASYVCDGDITTTWINMWSNANISMYKDASGSWLPNHKYEFVFELNEPRYISAVSYLPGDAQGAIRGCEIYVSTDNKTWQLAGSTQLWNADTTEKSLEFKQPAYAKYIKICTTEVGTTVLTMGSRSVDVGYATAKEFKFYENYACRSKTVSGLTLDTSNCRTQYKVGDKLDTSGLAAYVKYADGTSSVVPTNELVFDIDIFKSTDVFSVTASYGGVSASYDVSVLTNDRTANSIVSVTPADRIYYAGDEFDTADALVLVTDGNESWYLLPGQFTVEGVVSEGTSTLTAKHNELSKDFQLTGRKEVSSISVSTDDAVFKSQYCIGDDLDLSGMSVSVLYADGSIEAIDNTSYSVSIFASDTQLTEDNFSQISGGKTLRVSLKDKEAVYDDIPLTILPYISDGNFEFEITEGTTECTLTAYNPSSEAAEKSVEIPSSIVKDGIEYTVTAIESGAFAGTSELVSVIIPASVTHIKTDAFSACQSLTHVYMVYHDSLDNFTCDDGAFAEVENGYVYLKDELLGSVSPIAGYTPVSLSANVKGMRLTPPSKLDYVLNEPLDISDMTVTALSDDGSEAQIKDYTVSGFNPNKTGEQTVTVSINNTAFSDTFVVSVSFPEISITHSPSGAAYAVGSEIAPLTVEASAEYNNVQYQWYRSDTDDKNGAPISGADKASYTPTEAGYYYAAAYLQDEDGEKSEALSDTAHITIDDFEAIIGSVGYMSLTDAFAAAQSGDTVNLCKDVTITSSTAVENKAVTLDGGGHQINRGASFALEFFTLSGTANMTLKDVILDGGAVWTGETNAVLKRGTVNSGLTATRPLIVALSGTTLTLGSGSVLQNNYNSYSSGAYYTGGAVYMGHAGSGTNTGATMLVDGGTIKNNSAAVFGSAVYMRGDSTFTVQDGTIEGNSDPAPTTGYNASAICVDNNSTATVRGGVFRNNLGGLQGGVFWIGNGTLTIRGGTFENNSSENGGVAYFYAGTTSTLQLTGGTFKGNVADKNGGVIYIQKKASLTGGTFENNRAVNGGVMYTSHDVALNGGIYTGNSAEKGDAVYMSSDTNNTLTISGLDQMQEIYFKTFKTVSLIGYFEGKTLILSAEDDSSITNSTTVATMTREYQMDASINGRRLYVIDDEGFKLKTKTEYAVVYHTNGGTLENEDNYKSYLQGQVFTLPTPVREHYVFDGWYVSEALTDSAVTLISADSTGDKEYWAKWTPAVYRIEYKDGNVIVTSPEAGTYSVVFASYIGEVFISAAVYDVIFDKADEKTVSAPETFDTNGSDTIKVMLWSSLDDRSPKCNACIYHN